MDYKARVVQTVLSKSGLIFLWLLILPGLLPAQNPPSNKNILTRFNDQQFEISNLSPTASVVQIFNSQGIVKSFVNDPASVEHVIISFKGRLPFNSEKNVSKLKVHLHKIEAQHVQFKSELQQLQSEMLSQTLVSNSTAASAIYREYKYAFNGVALATTQAVINEIKKFKCVKRITRDSAVQAHQSESVAKVNAPKVWSEFDLHGENIRIGVIDTGIDYQHPALGGGLGAGYKVYGGYDFVNHDADPLDDNGHGTHVAGIIAANGDSLKGVAPAAKLLALKALASDGRGLISDVLAAIEFALNPDGDPLTDDAVDILNLSLGTVGHADDPLSQAVDAACEAGVVCVVSAGNAGGYYSINSPGSARRAITVGATDLADDVAGFSSKGPNNFSFEVKPEVTAPGVDIYSTWLNQGYRRLSGTSMAAPHVAGVAALLKQQHPHWQPADIKAAIVNGAIAIADNVFSAGAGRIDALISVGLRSRIEPAVVNFGADIVDNPIWQQFHHLKMNTQSTQPNPTTIKLVQPMHPGIKFNFEPEYFIVSEFAAQNIRVELKVDNQIVPFPSNEYLGYSGFFVVSSGTEEIRVPWAFIKSTSMRLIFDETPMAVAIHNRNSFFNYYEPAPGDTALYVILKPDIYDVMAVYVDASHWSPVVLQENIQLSGFSKINLSKSQANHVLKYHFTNEIGSQLATHISQVQFLHKASGVGINLITGDLTGEYTVSDISSNYRFRWLSSTQPNAKKFYVFGGKLDNIRGDRNLFYSAQHLKKVVLRHNAPDDTDHLFLLANHWMIHRNPQQPMAYTNIELLTWNVDEPPISRPFIQEAYFAKTDDKQFITGVSLRALAFEFPPYQSLRSDDPNILYSTPILVSTIDKRLKGYARGFPSNESLLFEEDVDKLNLGTSPVFWFGRFQNNVKSINILKSRGKTGVNIFVNQFFDSNPNISTSFKLIKGGKIIKTGNLPNASERSFLQLYSGKLFQKTLEISYPYRLNKIKGKTVVSATFTDNSQGNSDLNPPYFGDFGIYSNGEKTHSLSHGGMNQIRFTLFDERNPDHLETKAFIRRSRAIEDEWQPMPLTQSGNLFQADLSRFSNGDALYSLKITATDENNNSLSVKMLPAFMVGNPVLTLNGVISPSTVLPGQSVIIQVTVQDPTNILQVKATINSPEEHPIEVIELFNDGKHEDRQRQDHVYGNIWTTLRQERTYAIDVMVVSTSGDTLIQKNFITFATSNANPLVFDLQQNYPNPFNPTTAIPFSLGETSLTRLRIYNERGQLIRTLLDEKRGPGKHTVLWDGKNDHRLQVASGLYFYQLKTPKFTSIRKMILLR